MRAGLGLALALCLLPWGGAESEGEVEGEGEVESEGESLRCRMAPPWKASRLDALRLKLEQRGLANITYMVINSPDPTSQHFHHRLRQKMSENIALYAQEPPQDPPQEPPQDTPQEPQQNDIWHILSGEKDDVFVYDRCGRLTYHISLPYSVMFKPNVEKAIRDTYCRSICSDCQSEKSEPPPECTSVVVKTEEKPAVIPDLLQLLRYGHDHGHKPSHSHHHAHGQHHHGHHDHGQGQHDRRGLEVQGQQHVDGHTGHNWPERHDDWRQRPDPSNFQRLSESEQALLDRFVSRIVPKRES